MPSVVYIASIRIESCTILPSVNFCSSLHIFPYGQGGDGGLEPYRTVAAQTRRSYLRLAQQPCQGLSPSWNLRKPREVVAAAVATAKTAATAIAGPLAGAATAAVVMGRAAEAASYAFCRECREAMRGGGVVWCCLDCFLEGDNLNLSLFAYSVPAGFYAASSNIGVIANRALQTCVEAAADPPEQVLSRANRLLDCNGFGIYDPVLNNCFDFAFYCKTCRRCDTPARQLPPARDRTTCMIM
ncbi:uncharacterized protein [Miscanthus floridulus]|uniref:uncharacterized protein isoform X1 n=1 Tax=Miscanthus floridulus TaxID=154761 RepID=UPI0034581FE7